MTSANGQPGRGALARCVVLGGGLQSSPLQSLCNISVLDLPITPGVSVLDHVLTRVAEAHADGARPLPVSVVYGNPVPTPRTPPARHTLDVHIVCEENRWRGPAGVLLDACLDLPHDANILVVEGARWYGSPIRSLVESHSNNDAEVTIAQTRDREPAGVYVFRRAALERTPRLGFLDLKEQLLGRLLDEGRRIFVHSLGSAGTKPLRTLDGFLEAARAAMGYPDEWSVVDPGATIDTSAVVTSSVVMRGARVERSAVVARSIVLENAVIQSDAEIVDAIAHPGAGAVSPHTLHTGSKRWGVR